MTNAVAYCETVLPELAFVIAQHQPNGNPLNAVANLSSYFEREAVLGFGRELHAARKVPDATGSTATEQLTIAGQLIADCRAAFSARSSSQPGVTALYFAATTGVAEIVLIAGQVWVTTHHDGTAVAALLGRHLVETSSLTVLMRQQIDGARSYLAFSGENLAESVDGIEWESVSGDLDRRTTLSVFAR